MGEADLQAYIDGQLDTAGPDRGRALAAGASRGCGRGDGGPAAARRGAAVPGRRGWPAAPATVGLARELTRALGSRDGRPAAAPGAGGGHAGRRRLVRACRARPVRRSGRRRAPGPGLRRRGRRGLRHAAAEARAPAPSPRRWRLRCRRATGGEVPVPALGDGLRLLGSDLVPLGRRHGPGRPVPHRRAASWSACSPPRPPSFAVAGRAAPRSRAAPPCSGRPAPIAYALNGGLPEAELLDLARAGGTAAVGVVHPYCHQPREHPMAEPFLDPTRPPAGRARPSSTRACGGTCCRSTTT